MWLSKVSLCLGLSSFLLLACAQPMTALPPVEAADIAAEQAYQEEYLYKNSFTHIYDVPPTKREMEERLASIARRVGPAAIKLCDELRVKDASGQKRRCLFHVELSSAQDDSFNAFADGNKLVISRKLMQLVRRNDQLAFIMAHEFAHNIMGHLDDQASNRTSGAFAGLLLDATLQSLGAPRTGEFSKLGAQTAALSFSPSYEHEADYVGLYILKRAGYRISRAADVWRMMAAVNPDSIYTTTTHPTSAERFVYMKKTVEEIERKRHNGEALLPEMKINEG